VDPRGDTRSSRPFTATETEIETDGAGCTVAARHVGGRLVVSLAGELDAAAALRTRRAIEDLTTRSDAASVIVDCTALSFLDAAGLRTVLAIADTATQRGQRLRMANLRRLHHEILVRTGNAWLAAHRHT
jgi:anti-anti-sigma factor